MLIGGIVLVILLFGVGGMFFFDNGFVVCVEKFKIVNIMVLGMVDDKDVWCV